MKLVKNIVPVLLLVIGLGILAYPGVSDYVNRNHQSYALEELSARLWDSSEEDLDRQRELAEQYNKILAQGEEEEGYESILDFGNGVMGAVEIPGIRVNLPIYHGISEEVLAKGVGHMPNSALPIGGEGNHTVLTGHTGLPSARLFTDLIKMKYGELFYLRVLGETLTYRVDQVKVVLPTDGSALEPETGKDYCTLLTCTPYGVNSHRLLVRGVRTEPEAVEVLVQMDAPDRASGWDWVALISGSIFLVSIGVLTWLLWRRKRKK